MERKGKNKGNKREKSQNLLSVEEDWRVGSLCGSSTREIAQFFKNPDVHSWNGFSSCISPADHSFTRLLTLPSAVAKPKACDWPEVSSCIHEWRMNSFKDLTGFHCSAVIYTSFYFWCLPSQSLLDVLMFEFCCVSDFGTHVYLIRSSQSQNIMEKSLRSTVGGPQSLDRIMSQFSEV